MPDYSAGTASVRIRPNADDFVRDLNAKLKAVKDPGFAISVSANTGQAVADIKRFRDVESRNGLNLGVDVALGQAQADLARFRTRQRADGLTIKVDADTKRATAEVGAMRQQLESLRRSDVLRLNIGAGLLSSVQPAVAGLTQLAAGLQQVAQAGIAVPGILAGVTASVGTLVLGLSGISDAYKAVSDAADSSGKDQAASARTAVTASNNLRNAVVDEARARKDVADATRDARNELRDLHLEMRGGLINESRAVLQLQQARERLARGDYTDQRDALLDVQEAEQRILEIRARNADRANELNDANAKGVAGSDQVVAANERLVRSQQQVAEAQLAAADAATSTSAAQDKAMQELSKHGDNAKAVVQRLVDMRGDFRAFRQSIAEPLLEGKADEFEQFFDRVSPRMSAGMARIAQGLNQNITALFGAVGSDTGLSFIDRILGNTGDAQQKLSAVMDPLVRVMGTLTAAGSETLPRLADAAGSVATRLANFLTEADQDGRLDKWINDGLSGMTMLGESVLNVGKIFTGITQAAGGGNTFLGWLEKVTGRWAAWVNSDEGQSKISKWLDSGMDQLQMWGELLAKIPGAFQSLADGVQPYIGTVIDLMKALAGIIGDHPDLVMAVLTAYMTWKTINPIIGGVQSLMSGLSVAVTNLGTGFAPMRDKARAAMGDVDDTFKKAGNAGSGLNKFSGSLAALGSGVGGGVLGVLATVAIPAFVGAMDEMNRKTREAEQASKALNEIQLQLESTLDRVTGKVTAATRDQAIRAARDVNTTGLPGGGVDGITQGNAVDAAVSLGIPPDVYADALVGKPEAVQKVRDILLKNNLVPEFQANAQLASDAGFISNVTGGAISQDKLLAALIGDPKAVEEYTKALAAAELTIPEEQRGRLGQMDLLSIARRLSATGKASVFSGGWMNQTLRALPGAVTGSQQQNQANYGRYRIHPGAGSPFPNDAQVNSTGTEAKVTVPGNLAGQLTMQRIQYITNPDGTLTASVPLDSPYIEKYEKGGMVPGRGPKVAILHGGELVVPAPAVRALAASRGFYPGGEMVDEFGNPVTPGAAPGPGGMVSGPATAAIAPNPTAPGSGGVGNILSQVVSGMQGPIGNALALGQQLGSIAAPAPAGGGGVDPNTTVHGAGAGAAPGGGLGSGLGAITGGGDFASRMAGIPGFAGLFGSLASPDPQGALMNWGSQTANWVADWGMNTLSSVGSTLWQGALGFFGLENSILSPSNPYNQAIAQTGQFYMDQQGPIGQLLGMGSGGAGGGTLTTPGALGAQYGLDDATLAGLFGQTGDQGALRAMSPAAQRAILYAQQHAVGQKYEYGGTGVTGGYDCSGIASQLYAAYMGLPAGRYFDTEADFESMGFKQGYKPGALNIGVQRGGGGPNSHMAVTLPNGVAVESGGSHGSTAYGGPARGANTFPLQWYLEPPPGFEKGGPTPDYMGPVDSKGGHLAVVHPKEFMISARGRAAVSDSFLHKLNRGVVDPAELGLRGYAAGGAIRPLAAAAIRPTPPRPPVTPARTLNPRPAQPSTPAQARPAAPAPSTGAPAAPPAAPPTAAAQQQQRPVAASGMPSSSIIAKNQGAGGINHNVDWMNTLIQSSASNLGQLASTAMSIASMGGAGIPGMGAIGAAGPFVAGGIQQGGKIVEGIVNVVSSALVGSVPGSFGGETGASPYGRVIAPDPQAAVTGGSQTTNNFNGISDINRLMDRIELNDKMTTQATLAKHYA
ncbi:MAG: hypothetical protein PGN30_10160 [Mycolicibacterium neoaurum]|uniref:hypothetical protein n=1 Tax=Mycolicibacterium neoaurum TaxID=1795 RepID=UPI002FFAE966